MQNNKILLPLTPRKQELWYKSKKRVMQIKHAVKICSTVCHVLLRNIQPSQARWVLRRFHTNRWDHTCVDLVLMAQLVEDDQQIQQTNHCILSQLHSYPAKLVHNTANWHTTVNNVIQYYTKFTISCQQHVQPTLLTGSVAIISFTTSQPHALSSTADKGHTYIHC